MLSRPPGENQKSIKKEDGGGKYFLGFLEEPMRADDILLKSGLNSSELNQQLTLLELSGKIKNIGGIFHRAK